jgi:hypothetical protein
LKKPEQGAAKEASPNKNDTQRAAELLTFLRETRVPRNRAAPHLNNSRLQRLDAIRGLGLLGSKAALDGLISLLRRPWEPPTTHLIQHRAEQVAVFTTLGKTGHPKALEALTNFQAEVDRRLLRRDGVVVATRWYQALEEAIKECNRRAGIGEPDAAAERAARELLHRTRKGAAE